MVYGCEDMPGLEEALLEIDTLRKIDIFDYDGTLAAQQFRNITESYYPLFVKLEKQVEKYYR